jgi:hypothetical protein
MDIVLCLAIFLFLFLFCFLKKKEGFDPSLPDTKPANYPDQSSNGDLLLAEKYIQKLIESPTTDKEKVKYLSDLLNLLQFI